MQKNNPSTQCTINIVNDTTPVFVINNLGTNTTASSVCTEVMNTITLPSSQFILFSEDELSYLHEKDIYFIQNIDQFSIDTTYIKRLLSQVQPHCRIAKVIKLSDFIYVHSIDPNVSIINLFDIRKSFNIDDSSFRNHLIYFANVDENDLEDILETHFESELDVDEINALMYCYQEVINEK